MYLWVSLPLQVGVEAEECNKIKSTAVKEEMEEPKEAAVNKREGAAKFELSDEGKRALKMSDDKGRKVSKGGILIRSLLGGSSAGGRAQLEITDAAHGPIIAYCTASWRRRWS